MVELPASHSLPKNNFAVTHRCSIHFWVIFKDLAWQNQKPCYIVSGEKTSQKKPFKGHELKKKVPKANGYQLFHFKEILLFILSWLANDGILIRCVSMLSETAVTHTPRIQNPSCSTIVGLNPIPRTGL